VACSVCPGFSCASFSDATRRSSSYASDDLLLAGSSIYESDPAILNALMAEWSSGNSYQVRVDHLLGNSGGGANTSFILSPATVSNDTDVDYLTGNGGQDLFLADSLQDVINDQDINETYTHIDAWNPV
jgi:hypothetical protein